MKALFDTNILVDYLSGVKEAKKELSLYETRLVSVITQIEVLVGVEGKDQENIVRSFLSTFELVELTSEIAERAVRVRKDFRMKVPDAIIYATAKEENCLVVTRNVKDFKQEWADVRIPYSL